VSEKQVVLRLSPAQAKALYRVANQGFGAAMLAQREKDAAQVAIEKLGDAMIGYKPEDT
jgi:hypothetical protein